MWLQVDRLQAGYFAFEMGHDFLERVGLLLALRRVLVASDSIQKRMLLGRQVRNERRVLDALVFGQLRFGLVLQKRSRMSRL